MLGQDVGVCSLVCDVGLKDCCDREFPAVEAGKSIRASNRGDWAPLRLRAPRWSQTDDCVFYGC